MRISSAAAVVLLLLGAELRGLATAPLPAGIWGGQGIELTVSAEGARIDYGCDSGTIDERLQTDSTGKLTARGTHTFGQGGPRRPGEPAAKVHKASFTGIQEGQTMRMTVHLPDLGRQLGEFVLQLGHRASLDRCG
jgi:hypothetical protein